MQFFFSLFLFFFLFFEMQISAKKLEKLQKKLTFFGRFYRFLQIFRNPQNFAEFFAKIFSRILQKCVDFEKC